MTGLCIYCWRPTVYYHPNTRPYVEQAVVPVAYDPNMPREYVPAPSAPPYDPRHQDLRISIGASQRV